MDTYKEKSIIHSITIRLIEFPLLGNFHEFVYKLSSVLSPTTNSITCSPSLCRGKIRQVILAKRNKVFRLFC